MLPPDAAQLCFGRVRHVRLRPARHAFAYASYYVRLPIRALQERDFGCVLFSRNRFNLLSFFDADHGDGKQPLTTWIDALLRSEGVLDADGPVWLQTMPRVLGFVFNPVSFWFCHRADGALRAVLCDVRNTFGERHFYLLENGAAIADGSELAARKVFHVSPFCRVEGRYRFRFFRKGAGTTVAAIDYEDADGPLLLTSVSGRAAPLTNGTVARAFFQYPLMTLAVVVRIHLQAWRLWRQRVTFFSKPAPPVQKVSR